MPGFCNRVPLIVAWLIIPSMVSATTSPGLPLTTADAHHDQPRKYDWNPRHIRWGDVLRYQHWGGLLILIPAAVLTSKRLLKHQHAAACTSAGAPSPVSVHATMPQLLSAQLNYRGPWVANTVCCAVLACFL
jgi:hypothetical protein